MIDWRLVGFSALWIVGLSINLAAMGFAYADSAERSAGFRTVLAGPRYQMAWNVGMTLFCLGLLGGAGAWWEYLAWAVLGLVFGYQAFAAWRSSRAGRKAPENIHTPEGLK